MASATEMNQLSALKYTGKNFTLWKTKVLSYLESTELVHTLERDAFRPNSEVKEQMIDTQKARAAYAVLMMTLQDSQIQFIVDIPRGNVYQAWKTITGHFERTTQSNKVLLRRQLHQCKLGENESVDPFISKIKQLTLVLESMKETVTNGEKLVALLGGLSDGYGALVDSLSMNEKLTFEEACVFIKDREERIKMKSEVLGSSSEEVSYVNEHSKQYNSHGNNNRGDDM